MSHAPGDTDDRPLRPRMGKRERARDRVATSTPAIARLVRHGHGRRGPGRRLRARMPEAAPGFAPKRSARRVVVKSHIQRLSRFGAQAAARHLRYIERDGVEKDGSPGVLYGPEGPVARETFEQPRLGERHQFRFIVSPEDGEDLDLTAFTRSFMKCVEGDLGRRLEWAAVNHHDTDHPHAHIVVRGVDLDGSLIVIKPAYLFRGMRWRAQELATDWLGPRLESEIQQSYEREVFAQRLTSLDPELARHAAEGPSVDPADFRAREGYPQPDLLLRRLVHLEHLGLAERAGDGAAWVLRDGWQEELRELGFRGDRLKQLHRAMHGIDPDRLHVVGPGQGIPDGRGGVVEGPVVGRLVRKGLADEAKGTYFALVETLSGDVYHVPLSGRAVDRLEPGALVTVSSVPKPAAVQSMDRFLDGVARTRGGVYTHAPDAGLPPDPHEIRVLARLRELGAQGLATEETPGRWKIPPNLLAELERRGREAPRYRISVEPKAVAPLDHEVQRQAPIAREPVAAAKIVAPPELPAASAPPRERAPSERPPEGRASPAVAGGDPNRRDERRRAAAQALARAARRPVLEHVPAGFEGRVREFSESERKKLPEVQGYLAILGTNRTVVLVEDSPKARALVGRTVKLELAPGDRAVRLLEVRRDPDLVLPRPPDRGRGGLER